jgi:hypothetical protein
MRYFVVLASIILLLAGAASAQLPGSIGIFADAGGTDCNLADTGSLVIVYVLHVHTDGATASQFRIDISGTGWTWMGDNWPWTVIGNSIVGVSYGYSTCQSGSIYLGSVNFLGTNVAPCTHISVEADPMALSGQIEAIDCSDPPVKFFPTGGHAIVNQTPECMCSVPVESTTWGGVKALYR